MHTARSKMILSDTLSRRPDHCPNEDHNNEDMTMLPDNLFVNLLDTDLQERIVNSKEFDFDVNKVVKTLLENGPTLIRNDLEDWKIETNEGQTVIFYKGRNYIPKDRQL